MAPPTILPLLREPEVFIRAEWRQWCCYLNRLNYPRSFSFSRRAKELDLFALTVSRSNLLSYSRSHCRNRDLWVVLALALIHWIYSWPFSSKSCWFRCQTRPILAKFASITNDLVTWGRSRSFLFLVLGSGLHQLIKRTKCLLLTSF